MTPADIDRFLRLLTPEQRAQLAAKLRRFRDLYGQELEPPAEVNGRRTISIKRAQEIYDLGTRMTIWRLLKAGKIEGTWSNGRHLLIVPSIEKHLRLD
jgi:hypothetical protein